MPHSVLHSSACPSHPTGRPCPRLAAIWVPSYEHACLFGAADVIRHYKSWGGSQCRGSNTRGTRCNCTLHARRRGPEYEKAHEGTSTWQRLCPSPCIRGARTPSVSPRQTEGEHEPSIARATPNYALLPASSFSTWPARNFASGVMSVGSRRCPLKSDFTAHLPRNPRAGPFQDGR